MSLGIRKSHLAMLLVVSALVITAGCIGGDQAANGNEDTDTDSGNGEPNTQVTSLDVSITGYQAGQIEGGIRIRARELDQENPDLRVDEINGNQVIIYNNAEGVGYVYDSDSEKWMQVSGTMADQFVDSFIESAKHIQDVVADYGVGDTASLSYGNQAATWTKNAENPSFSDDLFRPPQGAEVEQTRTFQ